MKLDLDGFHFGEFEVATPPLGIKTKVHGYKRGIFGIYEKFKGFAVTHIPTGWGIQVLDNIDDAKALCVELGKNRDWFEIRTCQGAVVHLPASCGKQLNKWMKERGLR